MEIGESIAVAAALLDPLSANCPFKIDGPDSDEEAEAPPDDDHDSADSIQESSGGVLGENLGRGSPAGWGKSGTVNDHCPPRSIDAKPRRDSTTNPNLRIKVNGTDYGFIVAAHHLIPGDAALSPSGLYKKFMKKGGKVTSTAGKTYTLKSNIGYNVNGNHNGIWLPGNYAIRKSKPQFNSTGKTWSEITDANWCFEYMEACVEQAGGQFHDAHTKYSAAVLDVLNKIEQAFIAHQDSCEECKSKTDMNPPYVLKTRLYLLSTYLRMQVRVKQVWKNPWITSDRFKDELQTRGRIKPEPPKLGVIALGPGGG